MSKYGLNLCCESMRLCGHGACVDLHVMVSIADSAS